MRNVVIAIIFAVSVLPSRISAQATPFPDGVAVGDVTHDAAIVWVRAPGHAEVRVEVATNPTFIGAQTGGTTRIAADDDSTARVDVRGLQAGQRYYYRVYAGNVLGPSGEFGTAPPIDGDAPLSLMWGADTHERHQPFRVFQGMRARAPDLFLYLGDTIYADQGLDRALTLDQYRRKYRTNRQDSHLRGFLAAVSTWVVWDDHEVDNDFHSGHPRMAIGLRALLEYWPIRSSPDDPRRLYRSVRWGRTAEIFILDTRQYRSPQEMPDGAGKTLLGPTQRRWLLDGLRNSRATVKIVASSVPLRYHGRDTWDGYRTERNEILGFVSAQRILNVIFLVGDAHYAALTQHPEGLYEGMSGPLAAPNIGVAHAAGRPGVLWADSAKNNYGWLRITGDQVHFEWRDELNNLMYETQIPIAR